MPSVYVQELGLPQTRAATLASAFCEEAEFNDDYGLFLKARCVRLAEFANKLIE